MRRAAGLARSTAPSGSTTTTGSGNESIVACAVCCARSSRAVPACRNSRMRAGHRVERDGQLAQLVAGRGRARPGRGRPWPSPGPPGSPPGSAPGSTGSAARRSAWRRPPTPSRARTIRRIDTVGGVARPGVLVLHVLLVQVEHRVGLALDLLERRQELGEVEPGPLLLLAERQGEEALGQLEVARRRGSSACRPSPARPAG